MAAPKTAQENRRKLFLIVFIPFLKTSIPFISKRLRFCFTLIVGDNTSIVKLF